MFIQGNLQNVFDALYSMGIINPVLKADWAPADESLRKSPHRLRMVVQAVNQCGNNREALLSRLKEFDQETLMFLAMEVAREFVEFEDRKVVH